MRAHVVSHWRAWLVLAAIVIVANEIVDRNFFDHREHIDGDFLVTVFVLLVAVSLSYAVTRMRSGRTT